MSERCWTSQLLAFGAEAVCTPLRAAKIRAASGHWLTMSMYVLQYFLTRDGMYVRGTGIDALLCLVNS